MEMMDSEVHVDGFAVPNQPQLVPAPSSPLPEGEAVVIPQPAGPIPVAWGGISY